MVRTLLITCSCLLGWLLAELAAGQEAPRHHFHTAHLPPGTVAGGQLLRNPMLPGHFQPVKLLLPEGARVSLLADGHFLPPQPGPVTAGMLVGSVYQLKISNIRFYEGHEVYPTLEILNRLYPPPGQELQFPVPIEFTRSELEMALSGQLVTRVVYLEDPDTALDFADEPDHQRYFEVSPRQDALQAADRLGRPMLIMRMGSRVPDLVTQQSLMAQAPPLWQYSPEQLQPPRRHIGAPAAAIEREPAPIPRLPLPGVSVGRLPYGGVIRP